MTFKDYYDDLPKRTFTAPKAEFIDRIASVCHCNPQTVRMWISGVHSVNALSKDAIAKELGASVEELFPSADGKN